MFEMGDSREPPRGFRLHALIEVRLGVGHLRIDGSSVFPRDRGQRRNRRLLSLEARRGSFAEARPSTALVDPCQIPSLITVGEDIFHSRVPPTQTMKLLAGTKRQHRTESKRSDRVCGRVRRVKRARSR